jgi:hypothetical protein
MNWTKLSAISEIVSSVAIVITLGYLAVQTQQGAASTRAAVVQGTLEADLELLTQRANDPGRESLWCEPDLTDIEAFKIQADMIALVRIREAQWTQRQAGILGEDTWRSYKDALGGNLSQPRSRTFWERIRETDLTPGFVAEIDELLSGIAVGNSECRAVLIDY